MGRRYHDNVMIVLQLVTLALLFFNLLTLNRAVQERDSQMRKVLQNQELLPRIMGETQRGKEIFQKIQSGSDVILQQLHDAKRSTASRKDQYQSWLKRMKAAEATIMEGNRAAAQPR